MAKPTAQVAPEVNDPNVILPDAIKRQIEEGRRKFEEMANPNAEVKPPEPGVQAGAPEVVVVPDPPTEETPPAPVVEPHKPPAVQVQGEETPPPVDTTAQQLALLKHQHNTLQGKYRSEVNAATRRNEELTAEVRKLTQQVSDLTARILSTPETSATTKPLTSKRKLASVTDDERKEYGDELIDLVAKAAQEIAEGLVAERFDTLQPQVQTLSGKVETREEADKKAKTAKLYSWLDGNVAGWREQDDDPLFTAWLDIEDPFSGVKRMQILANAMHSEDYPRVKMIFEGYVRELAATTARTPTTTKGNGTIRAETLAAPNGGRGRTDAIVPTDAPEVPPTPAEIKAYFAKKIRNPKSLSEAEIARMEGRIAKALANGAIVAQPRV